MYLRVDYCLESQPTIYDLRFRPLTETRLSWLTEHRRGCTIAFKTTKRVRFANVEVYKQALLRLNGAGLELRIL